jgi:hypothetical protein
MLDRQTNPLAPLFLLVLLLIPLTLLSCGLERVLTLEPPEYILTSDASDFFAVRVPAVSHKYIIGVEFYYKFYPASVGSIPSEVTNIRNFDELLTNGFLRISRATDKLGSVEKPYIEIPVGDRGKEVDITLDFADIDNVVANVEGAFTTDPDPFPLRRGVADSQGEYKAFNDFETSDADISSLGLSSLPADVNIILYALSFGREELDTIVYSRTVYLLRIKIEITKQ